MNVKRTKMPESLGQIIERDQVAAHHKAKQPTRPHKGNKVPKPKRARFKAQFYFKDGNKHIAYSLDFTTNEGKTVLDEWLGYMKLNRLIKRWGDKFNTVTIYANVNEHPDTESREYNCKIRTVSNQYITDYSRVQFKTDGNAVIAQLKQIQSRPRVDM